MTGYAVISTNFEVERFMVSAGYTEEEAHKFVTDIRLNGHFAVMIKIEDMNKFNESNEPTFLTLLEKDLYKQNEK